MNFVERGMFPNRSQAISYAYWMGGGSTDPWNAQMGKDARIIISTMLLTGHRNENGRWNGAETSYGNLFSDGLAVLVLNPSNCSDIVVWTDSDGVNSSTLKIHRHFETCISLQPIADNDSGFQIVLTLGYKDSPVPSTWTSGRVGIIDFGWVRNNVRRVQFLVFDFIASNCRCIFRVQASWG